MRADGGDFAVGDDFKARPMQWHGLEPGNGDIAETVHHISQNRDEPTGSAIRAFCLRIIGEVYGIAYTPAWHADLDSLLLPEAENWFSTSNGGSLHLVRDPAGEIVAAGGLYGLSRKRATAERLAARYADPGSVCQIVRVYLDPSVRRRGLGRHMVGLLEADAKRLEYRVSYLHADARACGARAFWRRCGYSEFSRFSYAAANGVDTSVDFDKTL